MNVYGGMMTSSPGWTPEAMSASRVVAPRIVKRGSLSRMLRALGYDTIRRFHMNEGHASLLVVELASELALRQGNGLTDDVVHQVKPLCAFTTHTPVPAGHDQFRASGSVPELWPLLSAARPPRDLPAGRGYEVLRLAVPDGDT